MILPAGNFPIPDLPGDLDGDGNIDSADWLAYVVGLGADAPGNTDLNNDGENNYYDFLLFKQAYEDFNPGTSFVEVLACSAVGVYLKVVSVLRQNRMLISA